jgi:hypothetical protein
MGLLSQFFGHEIGDGKGGLTESEAVDFSSQVLQFSGAFVDSQSGRSLGSSYVQIQVASHGFHLMRLDFWSWVAFPRLPVCLVSFF